MDYQCDYLSSCTYGAINRFNEFKQIYRLSCDSALSTIIWENEDVDNISGSFAITVESSCTTNENTLIRIQKNNGTTKSILLSPGTSYVITIANITSISATCPGTGTDGCTITLCASIHYQI